MLFYLRLRGGGFNLGCGQTIEGVLVVGGGDRTPSQHRRGSLEQGTELPNAHIGPWNETR